MVDLGRITHDHRDDLPETMRVRSPHGKHKYTHIGWCYAIRFDVCAFDLGEADEGDVGEEEQGPDENGVGEDGELDHVACAEQRPRHRNRGDEPAYQVDKARTLCT